MTVVHAPLLRVELRREHDVVLARQRSRHVAALLGFTQHEQTRISTAVSELARNAVTYAKGGWVEFSVSGQSPTTFMITISDQGPGIAMLDDVLHGRYRSQTGMGLGIIGAKRLMDYFHIDTHPGKGTRISLGKKLPARSALLSPSDFAKISQQLSSRAPETPLEEVQQQNRELMQTMEELRQRQAELERLNSELEDTNRGVVALYAELDDRADYLQRASDLKTRFISNMSHEFKTPLNAILSLTRLLLDRADGELSPEQEKQVRFVRKSAEDLTELVNDLLDLAKVEAGKIVVRPHEFEVDGLFSALRGVLRPLLLSTSVDLIFDDPVGISPMIGDESKVSQILRNFISNALKFTEKGHVRVSARQEGGEVIFAVEDTGIGIAQADQQRVFEEWVQIENPMQRRHKGTGLGLPLSKKLAELMGGKVWLQSEPGMGSTFFVTLPVQFAGGEAPASLDEIVLDPTKLPVLVVEDNRETMMVYEKFLANSPFQIINASTLSAARRALRRFRPIAIVLDILLHDESTWAFLMEVKGEVSTRDIAVFVVTMVENEAKAMALGADRFALKPVERDWLLGNLNECSRHHRKLLVIDDDEPTRQWVRSVLQPQRWAVMEGSDGETGLRLAASEVPAAIVLDLVMPEMNGFDVLRALKASNQTRHIPVVVHTGKFLEEYEREQLLQHAVAIVSKDLGGSGENLVRTLTAVSVPAELATGR